MAEGQANMNAALKDEQLLFGVFCVHFGYVTAEELMKAGWEWAGDSAVSLADRLVQSGALSGEECRLLEQLVERAVSKHGGNAAASLASFGGDGLVHETFSGKVAVSAAGEGWELSAIGARTGRPVPIAGNGLHAPDAEECITVEHPGRYDLLDKDKPYREEQRLHTKDPAAAELGEGGMGRVLVAFDHHLGRDIALKELLPDKAKGGTPKATPPGSPMAKSGRLVARFLREARVTGQLEHPSIVPVYELGKRSDDTLYYGMKLVRGRTLKKAIHECASLSDRLMLLSHVADLCHAVAYAHSRGVINRDIKPENIMVGEFGETVVLDWGLAKVMGQEDLRGTDIVRDIQLVDAATQGKTVAEFLGTPNYMPPEQAWGSLDEVDERSDIWSIGAVLYEILTGHPPFEGVNALEVVGKVRSEEVTPVLDVEPAAPSELASVAMRCLHRDKDDRYQNAGEVAEEIERFQSGARVSAYEYSSLELLKRFVQRNRALSATAVAAVLVLVASMLFVWQAYSEKTEAQVETLAALQDAERSAVLAGRARDEAIVQRDHAKSFAAFLMNDLARDIRPLSGSTPALHKMVRTALDYYKKHVDPLAGNDDERRDLAMAYLKLGDVAAQVGDTTRAEDVHQRARTILATLAKGDPDSHQKLRDLSYCYYRLGNAAMARGRTGEAREYFQDGLDIRKQFASGDPDNPKNLRDLSFSYYKLGSLAMAGGKTDTARRYLEAGLAIRKQLAGAEPANAVRQRDLSFIYNRLGDLALAQGLPQKAHEYFESGLAIREELAEADPANAENQRYLSVSYNKLGMHAYLRGESEEAQRYFEIALAIRKRLAEADPTNLLKLRDLSFNHNRLGQLAMSRGSSEAAQRHFETGLHIHQELAKADPASVANQFALAESHYLLGQIEEQRAVLVGLWKLDPENVSIVVPLFESHVLSGHYEEALKLVPWARALKDEHAPGLLVMSCYEAIALAMLGDLTAAAQAARKTAVKAQSLAGILSWNFIGANTAWAALEHPLADTVRELVDAMKVCTRQEQPCRLPQALESFAARVESTGTSEARTSKEGAGE